jgi:N-acetylglucosaminyl-diphospho-decaprenol L-rhamnosyltransferase
MHVTACIVGYRNNDDILRCVEALMGSTHSDLSIMICENGGESFQRALIAALPDAHTGGGIITVLSASNPGYGGAFNLCVAASRNSDMWWLINPDCRPEPEALAALVARFQQGGCDAVGGTLCLPNGKVQGYGGRFRSLTARAESIGYGASLDAKPDQRGIEDTMNYILGASVLIGRRFMDTVGPMREDYFLYAEEIEWCLRGVARGMRLGFAPAAIVHHHQGSTTGSGNSICNRPRLPVYLDERNKLHVVRDINPCLLPVALVGSFLLIFARYARRGAFAQTRYALQGWIAAIRNERDWSGETE